jgi:hypothetical protein
MITSTAVATKTSRSATISGTLDGYAVEATVSESEAAIVQSRAVLQPRTEYVRCCGHRMGPSGVPQTAHAR